MAKHAAQRETAILHMTDLHYGRKTASYDMRVFEKRLHNLSERVARIRDLLSGYTFDRLVIAVGGDVNDGTGVYPGQTNYQEEPDVNKQAVGFGTCFERFVRDQIDVWGGVTVEAVPGNHGRAGKWAHEAANWDTVAYTYAELKLKGVAEVHTNQEGDPFIRTFSVRGHRYLLYHGHDIRTFGNIPFYGMLLRMARWSMTQKLGHYDVALMGHFHTFGAWDFNKLQLLLSGTMVSDDDWALRSLGWESANKWHLFGCSDTRAVTWDFGVDLA